ncbi:hypothetical protein [Methanococcoides methylutens]|uniref:Polysaccharide deacetylase n=1 Tax=Methanococcoides methylutens MM1 TaxID=1434104 RepID=A0A0E3SQF1_METMT|nr:hypothetical protein [Methanococcoides methylutens]AKB84288.1 Polysaccharide deacetylase [Methanococcoides methylutens MM1]
MLDLKNRDFTIFKFRDLCEAIADTYPTVTVADYIEDKCPEKFVLMRHDVDRMPGHALETAKIEYELGIKSTYYFRSIKGVFKPDVIENISDMGHEIGYHYETLSETNGDFQKSIELFQSHLDAFRDICEVKTICMHGRPLSKYDNRDLWKTYDFKKYGIIGEAYLSAGKDLHYFTDTGRRWDNRNSIRDFLPGSSESTHVDTTDNLIKLIKTADFNNFYILSHPERWSLNIFDWGVYYGLDIVVNLGKKVLGVMRQ